MKPEIIDRISLECQLDILKSSRVRARELHTHKIALAYVYSELSHCHLAMNINYFYHWAVTTLALAAYVIEHEIKISSSDFLTFAHNKHRQSFADKVNTREFLRQRPTGLPLLSFVADLWLIAIDVLERTCPYVEDCRLASAFALEVLEKDNDQHQKSR